MKRAATLERAVNFKIKQTMSDKLAAQMKAKFERMMLKPQQKKETPQDIRDFRSTYKYDSVLDEGSLTILANAVDPELDPYT